MTDGSGTWSEEVLDSETASDPGIKCAFMSWSKLETKVTGVAMLPAPESNASVSVVDGVLDLRFWSLSGGLTGYERTTAGGTVTPRDPAITCGTFNSMDVSIPGTGTIPEVPLEVGGPIDASDPNHLKGSQTLMIGSSPVRKYHVSWDLTRQ